MAGLVACSPAHNWREVRVGPGAVTALMPCKPERAERTVALPGGLSTTLYMASCDVNATTFAVSALVVPAGGDVQAIGQASKAATLASVKLAPSQAAEWALPPRAGWPASGWRAQGQRHNGQPVEVRVVSLAHPQAVYQWAIYGDASDDVLGTWLEGMRWAVAP